MRVDQAHASRLSLEDALARMEREAVKGTIHTGRYLCRFIDWGQGEPLVILHGLGDNPRSFSLLMAHLSQSFRCIAYQQPQGIRDQARLGRYHHDHLLDDLRQLVDALHLPPATILGHSFGSTIALRALKEEPAQWRRGVIMCGFAHRPLSRWHWWMAAAGRLLAGRTTLANLRGREVALKRVHYPAFDRHEPTRWQFFLNETGSSPLKAVGHWAHQLHRVDLRGVLPGIRQPVLIMCGDRDFLVPHHHQEMLFRGLSNSVMFQIKDCGHLPMLTHPEVVTDALMTFVGRQPLAHECGATGPDAQGFCPTSGESCPSSLGIPAAPSPRTNVDRTHAPASAIPTCHA